MWGITGVWIQSIRLGLPTAAVSAGDRAKIGCLKFPSHPSNPPTNRNNAASDTSLRVGDAQIRVTVQGTVYESWMLIVAL